MSEEAELPLPYLATISQVADFLQISERRCYDLVREEGLRVKVSEKRVRVPRPKLKAWLESGGEAA